MGKVFAVHHGLVLTRQTCFSSVFYAGSLYGRPGGSRRTRCWLGLLNDHMVFEAGPVGLPTVGPLEPTHRWTVGP